MNADETLAFIAARYGLDLSTGSPSRPIEIPGIGRMDLAKLSAALQHRRVVEVGVEQGEYAEALCRANPQAEVVGVDAWAAYQGYRDHVAQVKLDTFYTRTVERMRPYHWRPVRAFSVEASRQFPKRSLDMVYLDANHDLPNVIADIAAWLPTLRSGGILAGHDYCQRKQSGYQVHVVEAVKAWTAAYQVTPWFILGSKPVIDGIVRDRPRSWLWVKP